MSRRPNPETCTVGRCRIVPRVRSSGKTVWRVIYTTAAGNEKEQVASDQAAAELLAARILVELNTPGGALQGDVTFESLTMAYLNPQAHAGWRSGNTPARHESLARNHLIPTFRGRRANSITPEEMNAALTAVHAKGYSDRTVRDIADTLAGIVKFGQARGVWSMWDQPLLGVGVPVAVGRREISELIDRRTEVPTAAQVRSLCDAAGVLDPQYATMLWVCATAGLRWGELAALRPEDIDLRRRTIQVVRQVLEVRGHLSFALPKHEKTRTTTFPTVLQDQLTTLIEDFPAQGRRVGSRCPAPIRGEANDLLFLGPRGSVWRRGSFGKQVFRPARHDSDYPSHLTVHSLRHFWVCDMIDKGTRIATVSKLAGHHSPRFTQDRYWGADDNYLEEALDLTS